MPERMILSPAGRIEKTMKRKSIAKLAVTFVVIVLVTLLALNGLKIPQISKIYSIKPVAKAISLGLDLSGGISTEYAAVDTTVEDFDMLMDSTVSALRQRLTSAGFTEANVSRQGSDRIRVEIPGVEDHEQVVSIIGTPAHLEFRDPAGEVVVEGKNITSAFVGSYSNPDGTPAYCVSLEMDEEGAASFASATAANIGSSISIYLDDELISAPTVQEAITDGKCQISMGEGLSAEEALEECEYLAMLIQSGALPLDIAEVETRAISATLGLEAIDGAIIAGIIGLALVVLFMLIMYRLPGIAASMALWIYVLIVFYAIAIIGAQLTLQGIAGILLGIGMAVDANVVIFERFREELKMGRTPENAVKFGFKNAGRAVMDSNVTTLIAAVVLLVFGTGTIKGFAITLTISVVASLFTAVLVTRTLLKWIVNLNVKNPKLYSR